MTDEELKARLEKTLENLEQAYASKLYALETSEFVQKFGYRPEQITNSDGTPALAPMLIALVNGYAALSNLQER